MEGYDRQMHQKRRHSDDSHLNDSVTVREYNDDVVKQPQKKES